MRRRPIRSSLVVAAAVALTLVSGTFAGAATAPVSRPRVVAAFDFAQGQTPENVAVEPDGSADVSLAVANQVVHVGLDGRVTPLPQIPSGGKCPEDGVSAAVGVVYLLGAVYVAECSGDARQGVWRLRPGAPAVQIAQLPANGFPNDMAVDPWTGTLYVADSLLGTVWAVPTSGGPATAWASGPALQKTSLLGANGIAFHDRSVWVGNTDQGTIVRIPVRWDGSAGAISTVVTGLTGGIDNFSVVGSDDTIVGALILSDQIVVIKPGAAPVVVLTAADGLSNPTDATVRGGRLYVTSGAYFHGTNPNLLVADICLG